MRKILVLWATALLLLAVLAGGCGGSQSKARSSVKEVSPNCVARAGTISAALLAEPQLVKQDLDGKVVEVYGLVGLASNTGTTGPIAAFYPEGLHKETVVCSMRNGADPLYKALQEGTWAVVRGYGRVEYDKFDRCNLLILDKAEVMEILGHNPEDTKGVRAYLVKMRRKYEEYSLHNRKLYASYESSPGFLTKMKAAVELLFPF